MKSSKFGNWLILKESEEAFLDALKKNPDDNTAWLVFADWLQDRNDPKAAFIRAVKGRPAIRKGNTNHLGERQYRTFGAWRKAILGLVPGATFDGNKEIAQALFAGIGLGEWDGETGTVYDLDSILRRIFKI